MQAIGHALICLPGGTTQLLGAPLGLFQSITNSAFSHLEENRGSSHLVKECRSAVGTLRMLASPDQPITAQLITRDKITAIRQEQIDGIPKRIQRDLLGLEAYLKDAYLRVIHEGNSYRISISHGLKGGMNGEGPRLQFRRQMSASPLAVPCSSHDVGAVSSSEGLCLGQVLPPDLLEKLQKTVEQAKLVQGKDIIAFVGVTGSGKSTAINHLLGCEMVENEINGSTVIDAKPGTEIVTPIGHRPGKSETHLTLLCERSDIQ